ncbi:MAG: creatininase family protein, partial [Methanoregula sp.]|nr:creatininase family protein [Methanoregula sp.]
MITELDEPLIIQNITADDYLHHPFRKVILPLGSLESHGPHMPLGTDTLTAYEIAREIAGRIPGIGVLPAVPYGVSEHYKMFPFTLSLQNETMIRIIGDILESLWREGVHRIFVLNGHDGNIAPIEIACRTAKVAHPELRIITLEAWWDMLSKILPDTFFDVWGGLGHGGEGELSMGLALFPDLCDPEKAAGVVPDLPPYIDVKWIFSELTNTGASGDPTKASREKGV